MISLAVEYALRAMSHLASRGGEAASSGVIAEATRVPHGYLSKILRDLARAQLVHAHRGRHGGFILAREPASISLLEIVNAVDPIRRIESCPLGNPQHTELCPLHRCLDDALAHIEGQFKVATLRSVQESACRGGMCRGLFNGLLNTDQERSG